MTRVFTTAQQKRFEKVQNAHMPDGCRIHYFTGNIQDEDGQPIPHYEIGPVQQCGLRLNYSAERFVDSGEGQKFFNEMRLPNGVPIKKTDLIEVVHRGGAPTPKKIIYAVSGDPRYGITATRVGLKERVP
jgi:hypothetical protein